jgi:hypothetical protein
MFLISKLLEMSYNIDCPQTMSKYLLDLCAAHVLREHPPNTFQSKDYKTHPIQLI